jgi:endo-1,4-beta-xylanase
LQGSIHYTSFTGNSTQRPVRFGLYLPADYHREPERWFPVLYFLHGLNEDYTTNTGIIASALESAIDEGIVRPMVLVTPDGFANSMWADSKSGHKLAETNFIKELIPHIETTYRCIPQCSHRIIGGFSMGGYGACRCAVKFPTIFDTCFCMDGALHTLSTLKRIRGPIYTEIFENDKEYFREYCLYDLARRNRTALNNHCFVLLVGLLKSFSDRCRRLFAERGITIGDDDFLITGCDHDAACIMGQEGALLFRKIEARMSAADLQVR